VVADKPVLHGLLTMHLGSVPRLRFICCFRLRRSQCRLRGFVFWKKAAQGEVVRQFQGLGATVI
jgi:hypothetical protein